MACIYLFFLRFCFFFSFSQRIFSLSFDRKLYGAGVWVCVCARVVCVCAVPKMKTPAGTARANWRNGCVLHAQSETLRLSVKWRLENKEEGKKRRADLMSDS